MHKTYKNSSQKKNPSMENRDRNEVPALTKELVVVGSPRERGESVLLMSCLWYIGHTPGEDHTCKNI